MWAAIHPDVIRAYVEKNLGAKPLLIYARTGPPFPQTGPNGHWQLFLIALAFALPLLAAKLLGWGRRATTAAVAFAILYIFLWGLIVWSAAIVSSIPGLRWNENVFVFVPFDIALPFLGEQRRRGYARVRVAMLLLGVVARCRRRAAPAAVDSDRQRVHAARADRVRAAAARRCATKPPRRAPD